MIRMPIAEMPVDTISEILKPSRLKIQLAKNLATMAPSAPAKVTMPD
jgi:hypothetical protein